MTAVVLLKICSVVLNIKKHVPKHKKSCKNLEKKIEPDVTKYKNAKKYPYNGALKYELSPQKELLIISAAHNQ